MDAHAREDQSSSPDELEDPEQIVTCHQPRPGKTVFTERANSDGWIAIDCPVDLEP